MLGGFRRLAGIRHQRDQRRLHHPVERPLGAEQEDDDRQDQQSPWEESETFGADCKPLASPVCDELEGRGCHATESILTLAVQVPPFGLHPLGSQCPVWMVRSQLEELEVRGVGLLISYQSQPTRPCRTKNPSSRHRSPRCSPVGAPGTAPRWLACCPALRRAAPYRGGLLPPGAPRPHPAGDRPGPRGLRPTDRTERPVRPVPGTGQGTGPSCTDQNSRRDAGRLRIFRTGVVRLNRVALSTLRWVSGCCLGWPGRHPNVI